MLDASECPPTFSVPPGLFVGLIAGGDAAGHHALGDLLEAGSSSLEAAVTTSDDMCFWLYTSGSTGAPKGTVHVHSSLVETAKLYAGPTLGPVRPRLRHRPMLSRGGPGGGTLTWP